MNWYLVLLICWLSVQVLKLLGKKRVINPLIKENLTRENLTFETRQAKVFLRTGIIIGLFAPIAGDNLHVYFYWLAGINLALGAGLYLLRFRPHTAAN